MIIAVDFDGTCVTHEFPKIGHDIGAIPVLKELAEMGHQLILFTMRSDSYKPAKDPTDRMRYETYLTDAVNWFKENDIPLYGVQSNPSQKEWTTSPKCYAQIYIDDAALGCPLVHGLHERPFVDWVKVREMLIYIPPLTGAIANPPTKNQTLTNKKSTHETTHNQPPGLLEHKTNNRETRGCSIQKSFRGGDYKQRWTYHCRHKGVPG